MDRIMFISQRLNPDRHQDLKGSSNKWMIATGRIIIPILTLSGVRLIIRLFDNVNILFVVMLPIGLP